MPTAAEHPGGQAEQILDSGAGEQQVGDAVEPGDDGVGRRKGPQGGGRDGQRRQGER